MIEYHVRLGLINEDQGQLPVPAANFALLQRSPVVEYLMVEALEGHKLTSRALDLKAYSVRLLKAGRVQDVATEDFWRTTKLAVNSCCPFGQVGDYSQYLNELLVRVMLFESRSLLTTYFCSVYPLSLHGLLMIRRDWTTSTGIMC